MNIEKDYYYILGVSKQAQSIKIKKAYRKLSIKFHPDKNKGDTFFEERFKEIQEAYEVLSSSLIKEEYDKLREPISTSSTFEEHENCFTEPEIEIFHIDKDEITNKDEIIISWKCIQADKVILYPFDEEVQPIGSKVIKINSNNEHLLELVAYNSTLQKEVHSIINIENFVKNIDWKVNNQFPNKSNTSKIKPFSKFISGALLIVTLSFIGYFFSLEKLKREAILGNDEAQYVYGYLLQNGNFNNNILERYSNQFNISATYDNKLIDKVESFRWLKKAADNGNINAEIELGYIYKKGIQGIVDRNSEKALIWFNKAFKNGSCISAYEIGLFYYSKKEHDLAINWFQKVENLACNQASLYSDLKSLSYKYLGDLYLTKKNKTSIALSYYKKSYEIDDQDFFKSSTAIEIGDVFFNGKYSTKNYKKAINWYKKVLNLNGWKDSKIEACRKIAICYNIGGYGINKNYKQAKIWSEKANNLRLK